MHTILKAPIRAETKIISFQASSQEDNSQIHTKIMITLLTKVANKVVSLDSLVEILEHPILHPAQVLFPHQAHLTLD